VHPTTHRGSIPFHGIHAGGRSLLHLVQRPSTPYATPRIDPRRGLLPSTTSDPFPALRAPTAMATSLPVRVTSDADTGPAGSSVRPRCALPRRAPTSADRHPQPRGIEPPAVRRDGDRCGVRLSSHTTRRVELTTRAPLLVSRNPYSPHSCCRPPSSCCRSSREAASTFGGQLQSFVPCYGPPSDSLFELCGSSWRTWLSMRNRSTAAHWRAARRERRTRKMRQRRR
jgi:hypothetical protein